MSAPITRGQLLSRSAKGGAALLVTGSALGNFAASAAAAPLLPADLAYARLLVGAELLASDFYTQAIAAANTGPTITKYLKLAYANEQEHYQSVAGIVSGAGQTPAVSGDIDFSYPDGTFDSSEVGRRVCATARADGPRCVPRSRRRDPGERAQAGYRADRSLRGAARLLFHDRDGRQGIQPVVPGRTDDRPGLQRNRRVHRVGGRNARR